MISVLVTSTSFQDQTGPHMDRLVNDKRFTVDFLRGPLRTHEIQPVMKKYDAIICGDDEYTRDVLSEAKGKLRILSKYGVGLDKIDLKSAAEFGIPVRSCAGVNSRSVAEHVFALLLTVAKNMEASISTVRRYSWKREIGIDLVDKKILVVGIGNIGKEVAKRALAFEMQVAAYDPDAKEFPSGIKVFTNLSEGYKWAQIVSLHCPMNAQTKGLINSTLLAQNQNVILVNTARGGLIAEDQVASALTSGQLKYYLADVLIEEPIVKSCKLAVLPNCVITPHIGSRTSDNIVKQAGLALENMYKELGLE